MDMPLHPKIRLLSTGEPVVALFTEDMVDTLRAFFRIYQVGGVVSIQLVGNGLWLVNPHDGSRQFLGQAKLTDEEEQAQVKRLAGVQPRGIN
jgi:hypothetical protein